MENQSSSLSSPVKTPPVQNPVSEQTSPLPQPQTPPAPKKSSPKIILLLLILILILLISGGTYLALNSRPKSQPITQKPTPSLTPTPTTDPTANWKTYTNSKFGYFFKYPSTWIADGQDISNPPDSTELSKVLAHTVIISPSNPKAGGIPAGINITKESLDSALKRRQKELTSQKYIKYTTSVSDTKNSAGTPVKKLSFTLKSESGYTDSGYEYFVEKSGNTYELSGIGNGPFKETIQLIFETFGLK